METLIFLEIWDAPWQISMATIRRGTLMCTPVVVTFCVPDVNKIAAAPSAAHALGSAGAMGPWGSPKAHV